jgi:hypothetical protein
LRTQGCTASLNLGESERGMLDYFLGVRTLRREIMPHTDCRTLLIEGSVAPTPTTLGAGWKPVWDGERPDDTHEHFWLYRR